MERQEDGQVHHRVAWLVSLVDQWCRPVWPGARWAGLPRLSPSAGAGPGAAQRRRLISEAIDYDEEPNGAHPRWTS